MCRSKRPGAAARDRELRPVGRGHDDHAGVGLKAVHLDEQLVERLLALVVARHQPDAARLAERIELVDEDDARRGLLRLFEQVAHARRADADEHLDECRAADREERHRRLAGDGARE
jgi:hypothetical protein